MSDNVPYNNEEDCKSLLISNSFWLMGKTVLYNFLYHEHFHPLSGHKCLDLVLVS